MKWYWIVFGLVEVIGFFYFSNTLTKKWSFISSKKFVKNIFLCTFLIRVAWVFFSYFFFNSMTGQPFEFHASDALHYHNESWWFTAYPLSIDSIEGYFGWAALSDRGYFIYLSTIYRIFGDSIIIVRLIKALLGAWTCVILYRFAVRTFGEEVGRIGAILYMLMPNLIYYTGLHLKETEMIFLLVAFIDRADYTLRSKDYSFFNIALCLLLGGLLFLFRTVLGVTAFFALFSAVLFSNAQVIKWKKRLMLFVWVIVAVLYFMGGRIMTEVEEIWMLRGENQQTNIEYRSTREGGNQLAKYASASIFAPAIFILPFPTMVETPLQESMRLLHGGYYVKNLMAFFTMFALIWVFRNKKWRDYVLIGSFTIFYLIVIALSAFASSERFHLPVLPFELIMGAFAITKITNKTKKYYDFYLVLLFLIVVGWNWFKLAGRGAI